MSHRTQYATAVLTALRKVKWDDLEARLTAAIIRDETAPPAIDGYATNTSGDGRGGGELTSVEGAADTLAFGTEQRDRLAEHVSLALDFIGEADRAIRATINRLDQIDKLSTPTPARESAGIGFCLACCDQCHGVGNDRLRSGYCPACFAAWTRTGRPDRPAFERSRPKVDGGVLPREAAGT